VHGRGTYRQERSLGSIGRRQADLGVDVEETLDAAWRPDGGLNSKDVRLDVVVVKGTGDGKGAGDLFCKCQPEYPSLFLSLPVFLSRFFFFFSLSLNLLRIRILHEARECVPGHERGKTLTCLESPEK
jgi:hypothetical protein